MKTDTGLSVQEAATELGLTPQTVYDAIHAGRLPARRVGQKKLRIDRHELDRFAGKRAEPVAWQGRLNAAAQGVVTAVAEAAGAGVDAILAQTGDTALALRWSTLLQEASAALVKCLALAAGDNKLPDRTTLLHILNGCDSDATAVAILDSAAADTQSTEAPEAALLAGQRWLDKSPEERLATVKRWREVSAQGGRQT